MKISFCTTCKDRIGHLRETLAENIRHNPPGRNYDVEFVLLDYNSPDGLKDWILGDRTLKPHREDGTLRYVSFPGAGKFNPAPAKNMACRAATGDILCNLDGDNFLGPGFAAMLAHTFRETPSALVVPALALFLNKTQEECGFYGRIALRKEDFFRLGGYDETRWKGWGPEDDDFINRATAMGLAPRPFHDPAFTRTIVHANAVRVVRGSPEEVKTQEQKITGKFNVHKTRHLLEPIKSVQRNTDGRLGLGAVEIDIAGRLVPHIFGPLELPSAPPVDWLTQRLPAVAQLAKRVW
jgi:hypothetical protein